MMANLFAILDLPVSLLLDPQEIDAVWRAHTKEAPQSLEDGTSSPLAQLHEARARLSDPVERLAHWLEILAPDVEASKAISPELMDFFSRLHRVLEETDSVLSRHETATSALAKAVLTQETIRSQQEIQACLQEIMQGKETLVAQFSDFESDATRNAFAEASSALGQLKFLRKWEKQCQERLLRLLET